ncbi:chemotaxis protein CheB [Desulfobacter latus]|uniref:PAS domain-containing protein n=1 Tax=Desulfobacter latus TaxID=2292 RepID=A0A850TAP3_9BACT|nr:chemotaxis protein CheB [Desulfobacter latus]NWH04446.1 PAS domain-containing protein [Desulfobacter latus]
MKKGASDSPVVHYVGIGASAGGLEAIEEFFSHMPEKSNLAFIVVQHLSPDYKSLMVELLSKKTKIPVHRSADGMAVKPNNIYMIPPKKNLSIFHGRLVLKEKDNTRGINLPIDIFLRSLAEDKAERAIAIILSGTGSDGARGVRAIKEQGGMVMVQDETTCKFNGMPRAAVSTGVPDFILPPKNMPEQLMAYVGHPYVIGRKTNKTLLEDESGLSRIFTKLREKTKVDFTYYKPSTITRRIQRRMSVNQIDRLSDYVRYLEKYPVEIMTLYKELLIGVTSFFRDADAMEALMESLVDLIDQAKNRELRFWVTACSTGEEAYTIAILAKEAMQNLGVARDIKIFATDLDRDAIVHAGNGTYPESIAADLTPRMLGKYFYRKEEHYQIARHIREMVVFAQHNLVKDPPFTKIDMISCRNLLIYLQPILQQKAMEMFNFSLNPGGILFLGTSETIGDMDDCFETVHQRYNIYRSSGKQNSLMDPIGAVTENRPRQRTPSSFLFRETFRRFRHIENNDMMNRYMNVLENSFLPLSIIVNEQMDILHVFGNADAYFKVPSGRVEYNINKMAIKDLSIPLATGIQRVFRSGEELTYANIKIDGGLKSKKINLRIIPLPEKKDHENLVAVFFEEMKPPVCRDETAHEGIYDIGADVQQRIRDLEQELQFSNENLQATIEELETSNEELQATNEELLSSNEELQSTNEELQSTNEELFTVNSEYQNKIIELTEMNNDVENLLTGMGIEILILDENNDIRKNSPGLTRVFNILEKDIGRPISDLAHSIVDFNLMKAIESVQKNNKMVSVKRSLKDGSHFIIRILPYYIGPDSYSGTILTFFDESLQEKARVELKLLQELLLSLICEQNTSKIYIFKRRSNNQLILENFFPCLGPDSDNYLSSFKGKSFYRIWPEYKSLKIQSRIVRSMNENLIERIHIPVKKEGVSSADFIAFSLAEDRIALFLKNQPSVKN